MAGVTSAYFALPAGETRKHRGNAAPARRVIESGFSLAAKKHGRETWNQAGNKPGNRDTPDLPPLNRHCRILWLSLSGGIEDRQAKLAWPCNLRTFTRWAEIAWAKDRKSTSTPTETARAKSTKVNGQDVWIERFDHGSSTEKKNDQIRMQDQDEHRTKDEGPSLAGRLYRLERVKPDGNGLTLPQPNEACSAGGGGARASTSLARNCLSNAMPDPLR